MTIFGLTVTFGTLLAQSFTVKGTVISKEDGEPLIGVAIRPLENPTSGVTTDFDGNYSIELSGKEATLSFTYLGMQDQQHKVTAKTGKLDVEMLSDAQLMDEVVVVAYGVRKKGTIAGSVSTVKADKIAEIPAAGFDQSSFFRNCSCSCFILSKSFQLLPYILKEGWEIVVMACF